VTWRRTIRGRIALSIATAVLGSVFVFAAATGGAFYLHERSEASSRVRSAERQAAEDRENLIILLKMGGAMAAAVPLAVAGAAIVGLWLAARALAPMREAAARAKDARGSSLDLTLPISGTGDEWDDLAGVMNDLLREQLYSLAREKAFSANAAHELRTPLTAMLGEIQVALRRERSAPEYRASLETVEAEVKRLCAIVETLLTLARAESGELRASSLHFDLAEVARAAVARTRGTDLNARAVVRLDATSTPVVGDRLLTGRILDNLIENAVRHGAHTITVRVAPHVTAGMASVADDGPGLPAAVHARLFERFNKAPGSGEGFGLGLAIAHAFALAQGGRLRLDETAPGTRFVVELPLVAETQRNSGPARADVERPPGGVAAGHPKSS
jgi:signal transduction histidine kinase